MWRVGGRLTRLEAGRGARFSARLPPGAGMPKKAGAASKGASQSRTPAPRAPAGPVAADAAGRVTVAVRARPGARANAVTGLTAEAVCVAVAAPPSEGEANAELCRYLSRVLGLRRSDVVLDKGGKSRDKVVKLLAPTTPEETLEKLKMQAERE